MDIENAKQEFIKYTEEFDLSEYNIKRKQTHTLRVTENCRKIAERENMSKEEVEVMQIIGLLHDISRFTQYKEYGTYIDKFSFDHGDKSKEIIEEDDLLRNYIENDKYDEIIKKAIKNHNKYKIEEGLNKRERKFCEIIREADKLDVYFQCVNEYYKGDGEQVQIENYKIKKDEIEVFEEAYKNEQLVDIKMIKGKEPIYNLIKNLAYIFDINKKSSLEIIKREDYINKTFDRFDFKNQETKEKMEEFRNKLNEFLIKNTK